MHKLFISHSSQDDAFVRVLQQTLELHDVDAWIDSARAATGRSAGSRYHARHRSSGGIRRRRQPRVTAIEMGWQGIAPHAHSPAAARQGQLSGHPALAGQHKTRRPRMGRRRSIWPLRSTACCKMPASRGCWQRVGQVATPQRRRWATAGITHNSRRRGPASSSSLPVGGCVRRSTARSSCSSRPGRQANRRILAPTRSGGGLLAAWPVCCRRLVARNRPCRCWTKPANASRLSRRRVPSKAAERMAAACFAEQGDCLTRPGPA